jgi:hypothetical protein
VNWNLTRRIGYAASRIRRPAIGRIVYLIALVSLATDILWHTW